MTTLATEVAANKHPARASNSEAKTLGRMSELIIEEFAEGAEIGELPDEQARQHAEPGERRLPPQGSDLSPPGCRRLADSVADELHGVRGEEGDGERARGPQRSNHRPVAAKPFAHERLRDVARADAPQIECHGEVACGRRAAEADHRRQHAD